VAIPLCACPSGQIRDTSGRCVDPPPTTTSEDLGCLLLRELVAGLAAIALLAAALAFCLSAFIALLPPPADLAAPVVFNVLVGIAIGCAVVALGLFVLWLFVPCPKPCGWGLLMAGQIFFGFGWGALYFPFSCCVWLGVLGFLALLISAGLLYLWINECRPSVCAIVREVGWVVLVVIPPVIAGLFLFPPAFACATAVAGWSQGMMFALSVISAGLAGGALACIDSE
jgi:hypothetical protein